MASQLFRNLDRLAGVAGATITGERARRDLLTERDLGRGQQRYLQDQRLTTQGQLQGQRLSTQKQLQRERLGLDELQDKRRHDQRERFHKDAMGLSKDKLDDLRAKNRFDQQEAEDDKVKEVLESFDESIGELVNQARVLSMQKDEIGVTPEAKLQIQEIGNKIEEIEFRKKNYTELIMKPRVLEELNKRRQQHLDAQLKEGNRRFDAFELQRPGPKFFGDGSSRTTYKENTQTTDADKYRKFLE